ncbi:hypothetical protein STRCI_003836 [Streptomyces cinnabarinus]|uniref:SMI1/KNR4 family protein n=1 Tax=Streptomyces cinnabarinus TaxID=67287 RepID=A0ABY7KDG6_9ACTN|nr:hypothetical protein [Streptomyces cinnabarinus]WAZ22574.1 hypothetical protein STRCI_003836 [Streptomyces cinnabarinus]
MPRRKLLTMHDDPRLLDLLRTLDRLPGPDHLEFPDGYDRERARAQARRLTRALGPGWLLDDAVQDASFGFTVSGPGFGVRLSNYGDLAAFTAPAPDGQSEAVLSGLGYDVVPPQPLRHPYDGVTPLADHVPGATWWTRFFDYL